MGTLYDQPVRNRRIVDSDEYNEQVKYVKALAKKWNLSIQDTCAVMQLCEYQRRTELLITNMDVLDEQMAGVGWELKKIYSAIYDLRKTDDLEPETDAVDGKGDSLPF